MKRAPAFAAARGSVLDLRHHEGVHDLRARGFELRECLFEVRDDARIGDLSGANTCRSTPSRAPLSASGFRPADRWRRCARRRARCAGSSGSGPAITSSRIAMSRTVRAIGPAVSRTLLGGMPGARDEAHRRPQPGQRVVRGRHAHAAAGIGADPHHGEARCQRDARAARRAAGRVGRVVRIAREAPQHGVDVVAAAARELRERRLGENDSARRLDLRDHRRVARREITLPALEAGRHRHADRVEIVLDDHGHAE